MTKENVERLLKHYKEIGYNKAYDNLIEKYPEMAETKQTKKVAKKEEAPEEEQKD